MRRWEASWGMKKENHYKYKGISEEFYVYSDYNINFSTFKCNCPGQQVGGGLSLSISS